MRAASCASTIFGDPGNTRSPFTEVDRDDSVGDTGADNATGVPSIRLEIDHPSQASADSEEQRLATGEWACRFRILDGSHTVMEDSAVGSDALESIVNAISRLLANFNRRGLQAQWNEHLNGSGLPAYLPQGFGKDFDQHLEELVEKEIAARPREREAKHLDST